MIRRKDDARPPPLVAQLGMPALAGGMAVIFSHPLELTKVRLQLDNERAAQGTPRSYKGWLDCVVQNWRADGVRGLQRGLSLGIARISLQSIQPGLVDPDRSSPATCAHCDAPCGQVRCASTPYGSVYWSR